MSKPSDFFQYKDGILHTGGVSLQKLAEQFGTPLYVYQSAAFLTPLRQLQSGLAGMDHLICFAVKSCSNIHVLRLLAKNGAGMDLVSGGELFRVQQAGVPGEKIVFSGVGKTKEEIIQALDYDSGKGVYSFNVESLEELQLIQTLAKEKNRIAYVQLRFNPDVNPKTHPYISTGLKKNKFGLEKREILSVISEMQSRAWNHVRMRGLSIHIGSQITSLSPFQDACEKTLHLANEIEILTGQKLQTIDVGGGLGVTYYDEKTVPLKNYTRLLKKIFKNRFRILLEPGRTISANAGVLLSEVLYKKPRKNKQFLVIDASMTELIRPALYQSYHHIVPLEERYALPGGMKIKKHQKLNKNRYTKTDIVGPVCESADCFGHNRDFSSQIPNGAYVALLSAGAYGFTMASQYNSRPRPAELLLEGDRVRVIRKKETYGDLIAAEKEEK